MIGKLNQSAKFTVHDIDNLHRVGRVGANDRPRAIIIKFVRHLVKIKVMWSRKNLKGSNISIADDLSAENFRLLSTLKRHENVTDAWAWDGRVMAKLRNDDRPRQVRSIQDIL